jgi:hypothetical protein
MSSSAQGQPPEPPEPPPPEPQPEPEPELSPPRRAPGSYRPDLRPIAILAALLVLVVLGWLFLGPLILPPAR